MPLYNEIVLPRPTHQQNEAPTGQFRWNDFRKWHQPDHSGWTVEVRRGRPEVAFLEPQGPLLGISERNLMGDPDAAESPFRLQAMKAAPPTRAVALALGKYAREVALVGEAAK